VRVVAVAGGDPVLDQGAAGAMQLLHRIEGCANDRPHRWLEQGGEAGEHGGVDGVRLVDREQTLLRAVGLRVGQPALAAAGISGCTGILQAGQADVLRPSRQKRLPSAWRSAPTSHLRELRRPAR